MEKKKTPLVSIIIPVFNVELYINRCIASVISQTYDNLQIILIDDCGKDNSIGIARQLLESSSRAKGFIIYNHGNNRGLSAARNTGLKAATGDYVYFLDSDDKISEDCIEKLVKSIEQEPNIEMAIANYSVSEGDMFSTNKLPKGIYQGDILELYCQKQYFTMAWNKLIRRDFLIKNNLFFKEGLIHEDNLWSFQVACHLKKISVITDSTYFYLIRSNSIQNEKKAYIKHQLAYEIVTEEMTKYAFMMNVAHKKSVHKILDEYQYQYYMSPLWNNQPELSFAFYHKLRKFPHLNFFKDIFYYNTIRESLSCMHYYLPERIGFKWYRRFRM